MDCDILIVGAGPTGLVLALWLAKLGARVRIVDKTAEAGTTSRALAVQARTLELYRQLDLADAVIERSHVVPAVNLWTRGRRRARIAFNEVGLGQTPFPSLHIFPQDEHERLLIARLEAEGVSVERQTEVVSLADKADRIVARLRHPERGEATCEARLRRRLRRRPFHRPGDHPRRVSGRNVPAHLLCRRRRRLGAADRRRIAHRSRYGGLSRDFSAQGPRPGAAGRHSARRRAAKGRPELRFEDVSDRAIKNLRLKVGKPNWFSTYRVHHRVADHFRKGRAFLLGDAAHIHSPAGGQGMNTGIGDAINLAWKFKAVLDGKAPDTLLDSYESERIAFARQLVQTTDRIFTFATAEGGLADFVRLWLAPTVLSRAFRFEAVREFAFRTVSQINLNYRGGPLSEGKAGGVRGGDRLPWVKADGLDNFEFLREMIWQVHVYGGASTELAAWCAARNMPLRHLPWTQRHGSVGIVQNALYLIRPDTYVALADESASIDRLARYFDDRGLSV